MATMDEYKSFLAEVRKLTGLEMLVPDETGLVSVRVDDEYNLNIQLVEQTSKLLCFVEVATLPQDAGKDVYRELLAGGLFGKDTGGGYFALEMETETVVYNYLFDFTEVMHNPQYFVETLENILSLVDVWMQRIHAILVKGEGGEEDSFIDMNAHQEDGFFRFHP